MGVWRRQAPRLEKFVGLGTARAARAAGFEVGGKHLAEQARFARLLLPTCVEHGEFERGNIRLIPVQTVPVSIGKVLTG